jgi:hypothetical protein
MGARVDCAWMRRRDAERRTIRAFKQAMADLGIPDHPGGKCPSPDCRCKALADQVEARAIAIVEAELGHPLPEAGSEAVQ